MVPYKHIMSTIPDLAPLACSVGVYHDLSCRAGRVSNIGPSTKA